MDFSGIDEASGLGVLMRAAKGLIKFSPAEQVVSVAKLEELMDE